MKVTVINKEINVQAVKVISISGSSVFLVGDTQTINCSSFYDEIKANSQDESDKSSDTNRIQAETAVE